MLFSNGLNFVSKIDDPKLIENKLNKYVVLERTLSCFKMISTNKPVLKNMARRVNDSLTNIILNTHAVRKRIHEIKTNKGLGYDIISAKMLKWLVDVIVPLLT